MTSSTGEIDLPSGTPTAFPEDDAAEVMTWAEEVDMWIRAGTIVVGVAIPAGNTAVAIATEAIEFVKNILGDPALAIETATAWANAAAVPPAIKEYLNNQKILLSSYWEGGAHDAFVGHLDAVLAGMDETAAKLYSLAERIADSYTLVMDTYESAITFLGDCAANLIGLMALPFSLMDAAEFIKGFADAMFTLQETNLAIINDYVREITGLVLDTITFPTLSDSQAVLDRANDAEDWDVRET
jgi:hypothetical protein